MMLKARLSQSIFLGLFIGGLYFNDGRDAYTTYIDAQAIIGFFFFISIANMMMTLSPTSLVFPMERQIFLKEESSRLYDVFTYFITKNMVEVPYMVISPLLSVVIFYWMIGLANTVSQFFFFYLVTVVVSLCGNSLGMFLGSLVNDVKAVSAIAPVIIVPFVIFAGFFKNIASLPAWIGWIQYISPVKYGF